MLHCGKKKLRPILGRFCAVPPISLTIFHEF
jgi:hypothetical protein